MRNEDGLAEITGTIPKHDTHLAHVPCTLGPCRRNTLHPQHKKLGLTRDGGLALRGYQ